MLLLFSHLRRLLNGLACSSWRRCQPSDRISSSRKQGLSCVLQLNRNLLFLLVFSLMLPGRYGTAWRGLLHVAGQAYFSEGDQEGLAISLEFRLWRQEERPKGRSSR
jgi:hypothetical protein